MSLTDLPVLDMLKSKLQWHQTRQSVLAENVANADTPDYKAREVQRFDFERAMKFAAQSGVSTKMTNAGHIAGTPSPEDTSPGARETSSWEITPSGNAVSLEDQMMKVTQNQMDYQTASSLYTRALGLLRIALGNT